jgi:hypothetical protein
MSDSGEQRLQARRDSPAVRPGCSRACPLACMHLPDDERAIVAIMGMCPSVKS